MSISILLCAHNSKPEALDLVLRACLDQLRPSLGDELIVVDSGSSPRLSIRPTYSGHVQLHREEQPGLGRARVRGIRESQGDVILFVDDDTVLEPDYVVCAMDIFQRLPSLGAIGLTAGTTLSQLQLAVEW